MFSTRYHYIMGNFSDYVTEIVFTNQVMSIHDLTLIIADFSQYSSYNEVRLKTNKNRKVLPAWRCTLCLSTDVSGTCLFLGPVNPSHSLHPFHLHCHLHFYLRSHLAPSDTKFDQLCQVNISKSDGTLEVGLMIKWIPIILMFSILWELIITN